MNNDRFRSKDYYISVVVSDYDVTDSRFGMSNSFERRNNEHELKYGSSDDTIQMEIDIDFLIKELKEEILEDFG
jgi:cystathionine beta-lyase family protein involved in aluminum resistance